jgi:hypothetical protein
MMTNDYKDFAAESRKSLKRGGREVTEAKKN